VGCLVGICEYADGHRRPKHGRLRCGTPLTPRLQLLLLLLGARPVGRGTGRKRLRALGCRGASRAKRLAACGAVAGEALVATRQWACYMGTGVGAHVRRRHCPAARLAGGCVDMAPLMCRAQSAGG
jgi:hypothetical protein